MIDDGNSNSTCNELRITICYFPREICTQTYLSIFIMFVGGGAAPAKPLQSMVVVMEL